MTLTVNTRVGSYEIHELLGAGGMGEVYRGRDTRLRRDVAIKVLPEAFAADATRMARLEREAHVLASLNHPHIAAIYGLEEADHGRAIVMELVEGPTLADRIAERAVPVSEALLIAQQIAEALEAAHERSIVHRDLKPANIKLTTDGAVKVLDFGLAKSIVGNRGAGQGEWSAPEMLNSPTVEAVSHPGAVVGTASYMSPEQARGKPVDRRADIWAFGCVLFEMLTGHQCFSGETGSDTLAAILSRAPDLDAAPIKQNPRIRELLDRCLQKDVRQRWQAIGDVRIELERIRRDPRAATLAGSTSAPPFLRRTLPAIVGGALVGAAIVTPLVLVLRSRPAPEVVRLSYALPKDQRLGLGRSHGVAISPDGRHIAYIANSALYVKAGAQADGTMLANSPGLISTPFFSPDGRWVGYFEGRGAHDWNLYKIAVTGGAPFLLTKMPLPNGVSWSDGDQILLAKDGTGIIRVPAAGGEPEPVIKVEPGEVAQSPQLLPDGDHVLFTLADVEGERRWDSARIVVQSLRTGRRTLLMRGGSDARYIATGHLLYAVDASLIAVAFDSKRLQRVSDPVTVLEGISRPPASASGAAHLAVSDTGTLVFVPGQGYAADLSTPVSVDFKGEQTPLGIPRGQYGRVAWSPDGKSLALDIARGSTRDIWIDRVNSSRPMTRFTFDGKSHSATWTRDGQHIVFSSERDGQQGLFWQAADGSGSAERLTAAEQGTTHLALTISQDGTVIFGVQHPGSRTDCDVRTLRLHGDRAVVQLLRQGGDCFAFEFLPPGDWLAYVTGESMGGRDAHQITLRPFPLTDTKYQIGSASASVEADRHLIGWSPHGQRVFYWESENGQSRIIAVDVQLRPTFALGTSTILPFRPEAVRSELEVAPDGQHFLGRASQRELPTRLNVVLNWFDELKQRVPRTLR